MYFYPIFCLKNGEIASKFNFVHCFVVRHNFLSLRSFLKTKRNAGEERIRYSVCWIKRRGA